MQLSRLELKYHISEETALALRDFIAGYLEIDEFGAKKPNLSYPVHSLYLDSPGLKTFRDTINGNKNRYKLRLRYYDSRPGAPVFFEVKRRMNSAILKQRGAVRREAVPFVLAGQLPDPSELLSSDPRALGGIQRFLTLMTGIGARPTSHIFYQREAWISSHDNSVRVTMDRQVFFEPDPTMRLKTTMDNPVLVFGKTVILELKFTGRFPDWWRELVRVFSLAQGSAAKYADGIVLYGEHRFRNTMYLGLGEPPSGPEDPCCPGPDLPPGSESEASVVPSRTEQNPTR